MMRPANVELTLGHDIGVSKSYYKPTEKEILEDYLKAIDLLTINDGIKLQGKISTLQRTQDEISLLKLKHENEIKSLRDEDE